MSKQITEQNIIDAISARIETIDTDTRRKTQKPCRIKWNGKFIRTTSGKTVWNSIGAAKNALMLEFRMPLDLVKSKWGNCGVEGCLEKIYFGNDDGYHSKQLKIYYQEFIKKLVDKKILEFVEVDFESLSSIK